MSGRWVPWRRAIVPSRVDAHAATAAPPARTVCAEGTGGEHAGRLPNRRWAELMQRSFGFDVLACPRCPGRLQLVALIQDGAVIQRILRHLRLPDVVPEMRPSRAPPLPFEAHEDGGSGDDD